ncbi:IS701 family transposase [Bradyrhizobium sp.]|uniref:IS701 family transposase n=1 Tax=Bradyrhizobium sp. TaxID=376 RepID=UPI003C73D7F8
MNQDDSGARADRFAAYLADLASVIGDARRHGPMASYCTGLLMPADRKSVEPMAAMTAPDRTAAQHQSMLHFVGQCDWSDDAVMGKVRAHVVSRIEGHGAITAWIIDDTGFPKKGKHSVGVARQYCGQLGKQDNCQVAVSLSIANDHASLPVAYRMYLPDAWANDAARREKAGVPPDVTFKTKPQIALDQIKWACEAGLPRGVVLADAGYGVEARFRSGITALGLRYVAGVKSTTTVWAPGTSSLPPPAYSGRGRRPVRSVHDDAHKPVSVEELALGLPKGEWRKLSWREGTNEPLWGRFARVRVRSAHDRDAATKTIAEEWLLIEWPDDEKAPTKFWLSTLDKNVTFSHLVRTTKQRWRIERDYLELKQEIGLGHFEGRSWRGFHHHATLCIAAYGFLISERAAFSPSAARSAGVFEAPTLPENYRPRGAADQNRAPRPGFTCDTAA